MTSNLEINSAGQEEIECDPVQSNAASADESKPRLTADPLHMALNVRNESRLSEIAQSAASAEPTAWRGQHFKGTLGLRMAHAAKVFAGGHGNFGHVVGEQATQQESHARDAASSARAENVAASESQTSQANFFARNRHGLQAGSNKRSSTSRNHSLRGAGLTMALAAMFGGALLTHSFGNRTSEEPRKIDEQKRLLIDVAAKLKVQEEELLTREVETRTGAGEFERLIAEERIWLKAEFERKFGEQKRSLDEVAGKLKVQQEKLLTQETETRGRAQESERLVAEEQAGLKAEIERKIDEKIEGFRRADERKKFSDGLAGKQQSKGQKRAAATTKSGRRLGLANGARGAALATAAPVARPTAVPRPHGR